MRNLSSIGFLDVMRLDFHFINKMSDPIEQFLTSAYFIKSLDMAEKFMDAYIDKMKSYLMNPTLVEKPRMIRLTVRLKKLITIMRGPPTIQRVRLDRKFKDVMIWANIFLDRVKNNRI